MANEFKALGISDDELEAAIREDASVQSGLMDDALQIAAAARSYSPVDTGQYAAAWKREVIDGVVKVVNRDPKAYMIELGTSSDSDAGTRYVPKIGVKVGPNTPTPAFAPGEKAANQFGGTLDPIGGKDR